MSKIKVQEKEIEGEKWYKFDTEWQRKKFFHGNIIMICLCVFLIIAIVCLGIYILNHVEEMRTNPFVYGAKKSGDVQCSCFQHNTPFSFNETGIFTPRRKITYGD